jgi:hypothetical protein
VSHDDGRGLIKTSKLRFGPSGYAAPTGPARRNARCQGSTRIDNANAAEELVFRTAILDDRAVGGISEKSAVDQAACDMPFLA